MFSLNMLLSVLALTLLAATVESSSSSGNVNRNPDLSPSELTRLYNSPVYEAEKMRRSMTVGQTRIPQMGPISHSGVRVTLGDGSQWLIHKGANYGISSNTVVVNARYMSSDWRVKETTNFYGTKTVADLVAEGGAEYSWWQSNCHHAANEMMKP